ncbi:galactosylceramide sulfotransferase-like isoform X2 [Lytechinus variegatus]|uniref:galactosylceramide sulfotransferase-like isoform X2 n=1 Tax=Lytechinus variegatus TaxID=7654 RepID=UPI001BB1DF21|nr:galactosylceramide sulfotransferase-like isoform X2 [Lytechinus variegatus]
MFSKRNMSSMVRTYMMLCIAGLLVTVCILMVMYRDDGADVKDVVKVDSTSDDVPPNSLRRIKGANINKLTGDVIDKQLNQMEDYSDDGDHDDDQDEWSESSSSSSSVDEDAWLDQERKLQEKTEKQASMRLVGEEDAALQKSETQDKSRTGNIRIVGDNLRYGGIDDTGVPRGDIPVARGDILVARGDIPVAHGDFPSDGEVRLNQSAMHIMAADRIGEGGNVDLVQPQVKAFRITDDGELEPMDASKKGGGGNNMVNMRISGSASKFKKYDGGVQDLLRHPEQHTSIGRKKDCPPKNNIVMVKTHKCSSSTMQNILFRWGENRNLSFALPKTGVYLGSPSPFSKMYVMESNNGQYNIIANHMVYNQKATEELMPSDTVYIALLRNPDTQYESMYNYYRFDGRYRVRLEQFLKRPRLYFESEPKVTKHVGRNPMLFDIGLDSRYMERDDPRITSYIQQLDQRFDIVLIAEYFKESLILLKDILCWSMDDIVFFNQNARSKTSVRPPTDAMKARIRAWNWGDSTLYQYFNRTLWQKIEAFGYDRMAREVAELDRKIEELSQRCIGSTKQAGDSRVYYPPGVNVNSFILNRNAQGDQLCEQMTRPELTYIGILRQKQMSLNSHRALR